MWWPLIVLTGLAFVAFFMNRGREQAMQSYEARRDSEKADRLMAEVRRELGAKAAQQQPKSD